MRVWSTPNLFPTRILFVRVYPFKIGMFPVRTAFRWFWLTTTTPTTAGAISQSRTFCTQPARSSHKKMGKKAKIHIDESTFDLPPHPAFSTHPNGVLGLDACFASSDNY